MNIPAAQLRQQAAEAGHHRGVLVVCIDLEGDDTSHQIIVDDVSIVTQGSCYVAGVQDYPRAGTQVWTVKGRLGRGARQTTSQEA